MTIEMHPSGEYWQADQIAECLDVTRETYGELWNKCVPLYDTITRGEAPGEITYDIWKFGWPLLSDAAKLDVNAALEKAHKDLFG